ncbi:MAG: TlpA family protein disulfide reductase [Pleomorphochaeta sp.]
MNKNQRNSLILIIVIIVIFVLAYVGYGVLSENAPDNSYTPTLTVSEDPSEKEVTPEITDKVDSVEIVASANEEAIETIEEKEAVSQESEEVSNVMPDIPLTLLNGDETTFWELAELGKPVVINSFASWCPPCKQEMPHFIEMSEKYKGEVVFIFFDSFDGERETEEAVKAFAKEYFNEDTICVLDPGYISYLFKSNSLPTTILLDKEGVPVNGFQGMISEETLETAIKELL